MRKIEIIAEIGINHQGDMELAKELIHKAKKAGADVAKFQLRDQRNREGIDEHPWKEVVLETHLTKRQLYFLKAECDRANIEFMCSVFDVERVSWYEEVGGKRYKIASGNIHDKELADAIIKTGKNVIASYGMVDDSKNIWIQEMDMKKYKSMYCVSKYPASFNDISFKDGIGENIFEMEYDGYSDHTVGITACIMAMSLGARIIEKHFTLDHVMEGPDHLLSAEPEELRQLCLHRDAIERILYK
jgi:sialic acid synthase SpsE